MSQKKESESSTSKSQFEAANEEQQLSLFQEFRMLTIRNNYITIEVIIKFIQLLFEGIW